MLYKKRQKSPFFRLSNHFVVITPHFLGSKFEYLLTKACYEEFEIQCIKHGHL